MVPSVKIFLTLKAYKKQRDFGVVKFMFCLEGSPSPAASSEKS